jgi:hypothetical protein
MLIYIKPSRWQSKRFVWNCQQCGVHLGLLRWKHHCRGCGEVLCTSCCTYPTIVPYGELCDKRPKRVISRKPQKCCFACHDRITQQALEDNPNTTQHSRTLRGLLGVRVIEEPKRSLSTNTAKLFAIQLPIDGSVRARQSVSLALDGHRYTMTVPPRFRPGETFYVCVNDGVLETADGPVDERNCRLYETVVLNRNCVVQGAAY